MAITNRERVDRAFLTLRDGLNVFIDSVTGTPHWDDLLSETMGKTFSRDDVQTHLVFLTQRFNEVFKPHLSYAARTYANELRDFRNKWAHQAAFNADDTHRMLDSAERLLVECGQPEAAEVIRKSRIEHQRGVFENETKKSVREASSGAVPGQGLKPWREVVRPHEDVATGHYTAAEFAADLHMVAIGEAAAEYADPVEFFNRTYLTEGLKELLARATARLSGDRNASPVVNLQTNFGGGKTHSMLALYHLASGTSTASYPQELQDLLANTAGLPGQVERVALVGTHMAPGHATVKSDGTEVNTLWGELAWQLGGREAFDMIADSDRNRTNPGDGLRALLDAYGPALILIDEWVAYARQLYGRDDLPGGSFDTQFTFAQTLTEVAKVVPGVLVVISIPASSDSGSDAHSSLEVGGEYGVEALKRLQNVVRRLADQWRPATAHESFEIVRRRLFTDPDADGQVDIGAVARQFALFYTQHSGEFPREASQPDYERRIRNSYPIHPELFDRLYEDWSTLERFQRTRGVLRLMSAVVHALWTAQDPSPLIMSGSVPLNVATVTSELTQYLPDSWKPIVDADVDGEESTPVTIDKEKPLLGQRAVTRRLARTIFIGSAPTVGTQNQGIERPRVWLGTAVPGDTVGNFGSAIDALGQRATYFYADSHRYWYDTQASVIRTAAEIADRLREHPEDVWVEIVRRLREREAGVMGDFAGVHVAPDSSADVPDVDSARLVILPPQYCHKRGATDSEALQFSDDLLAHRGSAQRTNRNMVVMLAPDEKRLEELSDAVRDYLAWNQISQRVEEMNLTAQQSNQVAERKRQSDQAVNLRIPAAYIWAIVPVQPDPAAPATVDVLKADGAQDHLADRVSAKLRQSGQIATEYSPRTIRMELNQQLKSVWSTGHVRVGDLWSYYCRYPYLMRLRDRAVLDQSVRDVLNELTWEAEGFALAAGVQEDGTFDGLVLPAPTANFGTVTDNTLLVDPGLAVAQAPELPADSPTPKPQPPVTPAPTPAAGPTVFRASARLDAERYARDFSRIVQEIVQRLGDAKVDLDIEIRAVNEDGFPADVVRTITENATTLKMENHGFE